MSPMLLADGLLVFLAACVALDLAKRLEMKLSTDTLGWLVGSALALACGLWGAQVLGLSHLKLPYAVGYPAALTFLVWLAAVAFMAAGMALAGPSPVHNATSINNASRPACQFMPAPQAGPRPCRRARRVHVPAAPATGPCRTRRQPERWQVPE